MSRLISMAKKGRRWRNARVTRRDGWLWLPERMEGPPSLVDDATGRVYVLEDVELDVVEWLPRVGARWMCEECGWLGPTKDSLAAVERDRLRRSHNHPIRYRKPRTVGAIRVLAARRERLGEILVEPDGCAAEGFPELRPIDFCGLYQGREKPFAEAAQDLGYLDDEELAYGWRLCRDELARGIYEETRVDLTAEVTRIEYEVR